DPFSFGGNPDSARGGIAMNGIMYPASRTRVGHITDGTSKTFLIGECSWDFGDTAGWYAGGAFWGGAADGDANIKNQLADSGKGFWVFNQAQVFFRLQEASNVPDPKDATKGMGLTIRAKHSDLSFGSKHPTVAAFCFGDGSARMVSKNTDLTILKYFANRHE